MDVDNKQFSLAKNLGIEDSAILTFTILIITVFLSLMIGLVFIQIYSGIVGLDFNATLNSLSEESPVSIRNFIRTNLLINHLTTFVLPALIFSYFFYKRKVFSFLHISKNPKSSNLFLGGMLILFAFPLAQLAYWLNLKLPLPSSLIAMEESTAEMISNLLLVQEPYELWFNLLVVAVVPAIGEELIFRGIIQQKLVQKMKNPHIAIWLAAFIFSAIHMQFQGLFPRMLLGGILGYLFYWTGNLWIPIVAHFLNNAFQIVGQYLHQKGMIEVDLDETVIEINWGITFISLILVLGIGWWIKRLNTSNKLVNEQMLASDRNDEILDAE